MSDLIIKPVFAIFFRHEHYRFGAASTAVYPDNPLRSPRRFNPFAAARF